MKWSTRHYNFYVKLMILAIGWCWGCHSSATSKQRKHHVNIVLTQSAIKYKSLSGNFTKDCKILMCILVYSFMVFRVFKIIAVLGFVLIDMGAWCTMLFNWYFVIFRLWHISLLSKSFILYHLAMTQQTSVMLGRFSLAESHSAFHWIWWHLLIFHILYYA